MKKLRKIGALILAVVMIATVGAAFAVDADMTGEEGVIGEFPTDNKDHATVYADSVTIYKEITAFNPETCTVNAPAITYNYTITHSSALAGKTVTDASSHHNQINGNNVNVTTTTKEGVGTPTISGTATGGVLQLVPGTDTLDASVNGTANRFALTVDFSSVTFNGPGIYRYQINETTTEATKNASGIAEGSGANTLYMDVYVDGSGDIYGYVLFTTNGNIDASPDADSTAASAVGKVEGFVGSEPDGDPYASDTSTADKYYTFNLEVSKDVVNDSYVENNHNQFPFSIELYNATVTANVLPIMTKGTHVTQTALSAAALGTSSSPTTWSPTIADGQTVSYVGIPCGTTVSITETNNVSGVTYVSASTGADTNAAEKSIAYNVASNTATVTTTALTAAAHNHTASGQVLDANNEVETGKVVFTNTLMQISPTGLVLRFAPYAMILVAGIALMIIAMKRRGHKEEE